MTTKRWKPREILVHRKVQDDPITQRIVRACGGRWVRKITQARKGTQVTGVKSGLRNDIVGKSWVLKQEKGFLGMILAGKRVMYVGPAGGVLDTFKLKHRRLVCPQFDRLKLSENGCYYACEWCYLRLTYRTAHPYMTVRAQYDEIKKQIERKLKKSGHDIMFNSGELADSLSFDHITQAGKFFIPFFGQTTNGYLFMLTKSANVDHLLRLPHNQHTIMAWSVNAPGVSKKFEIGAPPFRERIEAARRAQKAGYRIRIRLDPIIPVKNWKSLYRETVQNIFKRVAPERITLGTLRFEKAFCAMQETILSPGHGLQDYMKDMEPMFERDNDGSVGKHSFGRQRRIDMFSFVMKEIRRHSDCPIALCKEEPDVWNAVGLDISDCRCVCQLDSADCRFSV